MSLSSSDTMMKRLILHAILIRERPLMTISVVSSMKLVLKEGFLCCSTPLFVVILYSRKMPRLATDARRAPGEQELPKEGNVLYDTHGAYLDSPRNVAKEMGVAFIDMNKITHDLGAGTGPRRIEEVVYVCRT